jgi:hypothetical protein
MFVVACHAFARLRDLHANLLRTCRESSAILVSTMLHLAQESGDSVGHQLLSPCAPTGLAAINEPGRHAALPCHRRILRPAIARFALS